MKLAVVGAGASGMAAALQATWHGGEVTLYERNTEVGRKLLVTGSGRCNLTNEAVEATKYACADQGWMDVLLTRFGVSDLRVMLEEIGIPVYSTSDGWYYPRSNAAHSVVEAFTDALGMAGVRLRLSRSVSSIDLDGDNFIIHSDHASGSEVDHFERVIVAAGGKAYPTLGTRGELFPVLAQLGHTISPLRPALAPVLVELGDLKAIQGQRLDCAVTLWDGREQLGFAAGNLIVTQWGLNGPAVMDLSHLISANPDRSMTLSLDLLHFHITEFNDLLSKKRSTSMRLKGLLGAFFPPKVAILYLKMARLADNATLKSVRNEDLDRLVDILRDTRLVVRGVRGFEYCQVSAGGVPVTEVNPHSMQSVLVRGLYLCGETLDVVGPCGGYNLQFAFSSGALAGLAAAGK